LLLIKQTQSFNTPFHTPGVLLSDAQGLRQRGMPKAGLDDKSDIKVPMRILLIVEPTPFTHISGYANRFKEYLKYQKKAGAEVAIITPDDSENAPSEYLGFPITTIRGFRFPLYKQIYLSWGFSPVEGMSQGLWRHLLSWNRIATRRKNKQACLSAVSEVIDDFEPDLVHVTSPGFIPFMTTYLAREWKDVPLFISYHTHIPVYAPMRRG